MSALGQKQTLQPPISMSALPPKADMCSALGHVRFVPIVLQKSFSTADQNFCGLLAMFRVKM